MMSKTRGYIKKMKTDKDFEFKKVADVVKANGDGWEYWKVGELKAFTQYKKLPSLRVIKTLIKKLEAL